MNAEEVELADAGDTADRGETAEPADCGSRGDDDDRDDGGVDDGGRGNADRVNADAADTAEDGVVADTGDSARDREGDGSSWRVEKTGPPDVPLSAWVRMDAGCGLPPVERLAGAVR